MFFSIFYSVAVTISSAVVHSDIYKGLVLR